MEEDEKLKEEFFEEKKPKKKKSKKEESMFQKVMNIILWIVLIVWMLVCIIDFIKTQRVEKPIFCLKEETTKYEDGSVYSCTGLGYKIYHYDRTILNGVEYGPFWSKDRSKELDEEE